MITFPIAENILYLLLLLIEKIEGSNTSGLRKGMGQVNNEEYLCVELL